MRMALHKLVGLCFMLIGVVLLILVTDYSEPVIKFGQVMMSLMLILIGFMLEKEMR